MKVTGPTADRAFDAFHKRYVLKAKRAWDLNHHGRLWARARASVESGDNGDGFIEVLDELRKHWQIARGKGAKMLSGEKILPLLEDKAANGRSKRLSEIGEADAKWLFRLINDVSDIKRVNGQPSLMAISKVLHFFNPRLFVIVDRAMVWDWTLAHRWVWDPIKRIRERVDRAVGCDIAARSDTACDAASYVAILIGCGELIRENPHVPKHFASFLHSRTKAYADLPADLETYEAAAIEWLLLGLVELPPAGVTP